MASQVSPNVTTISPKSYSQFPMWRVSGQLSSWRIFCSPQIGGMHTLLVDLHDGTPWLDEVLYGKRRRSFRGWQRGKRLVGRRLGLEWGCTHECWDWRVRLQLRLLVYYWDWNEVVIRTHELGPREWLLGLVSDVIYYLGLLLLLVLLLLLLFNDYY